MADFPSGTGMGSSGSYAVGLLKALHTLKREAVDAQHLAEEACHIEIDLLGRPIGKQDQYIAAFGGFTCMDIDYDGTVRVEPLGLSFETTKELENDVILFYTNINRDGLDILSTQNKATERDEKAVVANLHEIKEIGQEIRRVLRAGDVPAFGRLLDTHWQTKKNLSGEISNPRIDRWYRVAKDNGALGGKIMGAGGGGFFMFCANGDKRALRRAMQDEGLIELNYRFDFEGSKVLLDI
jgi:D-glycero-alpha-D-manno-heptose-7-phosphate kinase